MVVRVDADELAHSAETKTVKTLYSFDDFVDCMQDYLDADSLRYVSGELGKDSDNLELLNKAAKAIQSAGEVKSGSLELHEAKFITNALADGNAQDDILEVVRYLNHASGSELINQEASEYLVEIAKLGGHDLFKVLASIKAASKEKEVLDKKDIKYLVRAVFDEVPQEQISELIKDGVDDNFIIFNDTYEDALPQPRGKDKMGGALQAHHALQQEWAMNNLKRYGYSYKLAPTVTIDTNKGWPHTIINNRQRERQRERIAQGKGAWSSTIQEELSYIVSDFHAAGFSNVTIKKVLEQQYKMLDGLGVPYERIEI